MQRQPAELSLSLIPKTKKDLANEYEVCRDTIRDMCMAINIQTRKRLSIKEVQKFYTHYGVPVKEYYSF
ncbi:MAG: hypothetical protein JXR50_06300 [Prolixibacteraceae bacterium]|nr:hypothetical protein [Prolixibacteraceae bacterium]